MKKLLIWALCALSLGLVSCDDDKQEEYPDMEQRFAEITIETLPETLEAVGGKVPVTIQLTIPPRFLWPEAEVTVIPFLTWADGEAEGKAFGFQGENAPNPVGTIIPFEQGGTITAKTSYDFQREMTESSLMLEFTVHYLDRTSVFRIKAADGVITTS